MFKQALLFNSYAARISTSAWKFLNVQPYRHNPFLKIGSWGYSQEVEACGFTVKLIPVQEKENRYSGSPDMHNTSDNFSTNKRHDTIRLLTFPHWEFIKRAQDLKWNEKNQNWILLQNSLILYFCLKLSWERPPVSDLGANCLVRKALILQ